MSKDEEIMSFLNEHVFVPILNSDQASDGLKKGVNYTIMRMNNLDAAGKRQYYWSAISGTEKSIDFARNMQSEGFIRFEDIVEEFKSRFGDAWLNS